MGLPSAASETHVVSLARISRVKGGGGFTVATRAFAWTAGGLTSGWGEAGSLASSLAAGVGAAGAGGVAVSRLAGGAGDETGDGDTVFAERLLLGDADPAVWELVEAEV